MIALAELQGGNVEYNKVKMRLKAALMSLVDIELDQDDSTLMLKQVICYNLAVINYCEVQEYIERVESGKADFEDQSLVE